MGRTGLIKEKGIETRAGGYDSIYSEFDSAVMREVRRASYGEDIGQHSWLTAEEFRRDMASLGLSPSTRLLDLGCGAGGPLTYAMRITGCWATGLDASEPALALARERARVLGVEQRIRLTRADLNEPLVLPAKLFEAAMSLDVVLHLRDRLDLFHEVARVLVAGGRFLFTDAGVLTGSVSDAEILNRSLHAPIQLHPPGYNETALEAAGLRLIAAEDRSASQRVIAEARHRARLAHRADLERIEGDEFELHQRYLETVIEISGRGAVARRMFLAEKP